MLLTFDLAGKGARDDVAVSIRADLIADEDAPFEQRYHHLIMWRFRTRAAS